MRPDTALGLLLCGAALWLDYAGQASRAKRQLAQSCAVMAGLLGVTRLIGQLLGKNLSVSEWLFASSVRHVTPGQMSVMTAVTFVLLGGALFFSSRRRGFAAAQYLLVTVGILSMFNVIGLLYGLRSSYGIAFTPGRSAMAIHTSVGLLTLCAGALLSRPSWGIMATINSQAPGGVLARRLLPAALLIPAVTGWLRWQGQLKGFYDTAFGLTLFTAVNIFVFTFLIWRNAQILNRLDVERARAEGGMRQLADSMPQMVWTAAADGNVDYYNQRWYDYTGLNFEQTKNWGWQPILHPDDLQATTDRWTNALTTGDRYEVECRLKRARDGAYRWHLARARAVRDAQGTVARWFGSCTDIEEHRQAEAKIKILNQGLEERVRQLARANEELKGSSVQLEQSNSELQDFASVASHDLQEPLRKVQTFGDRLKTGYGAALDEQGRDYLDRMLNAAKRMQSLIQDLLMFSQVTIRAQPFLPVDLAIVTREVLSDLEVRIHETNAQVEVGELPIIEADAIQMRQLLQNLIGNALKFHQKGKAPAVRVYEQEPGSGPRADGMFRLIVEDQGVGFDEKYLDRIFTMFQRLHGRAEYEGTGVGLAICRKIVQRHGGEITGKSTPGQGASFLVSLPVRRRVEK